MNAINDFLYFIGFDISLLNNPYFYCTFFYLFILLVIFGFIFIEIFEFFWSYSEFKEWRRNNKK